MAQYETKTKTERELTSGLRMRYGLTVGGRFRKSVFGSIGPTLLEGHNQPGKRIQI